jgi:hypothetical protein
MVVDIILGLDSDRALGVLFLMSAVDGLQGQYLRFVSRYLLSTGLNLRRGFTFQFHKSCYSSVWNR